MERAGGGEPRHDRVRHAPQPLAEGERPASLLVAAVVCGAFSIGVLIGALTVHDLSRHGGSVVGGAFIAVVLAAVAQGMYRRRYWAVLSFVALLTFQILVTALALVVASTVLAAAACLLGIGLAGWLCWHLARVLGRMQASQPRSPR